MHTTMRLVLLSSLTLLSGCGGDQQGTAATPTPVQPVSVDNPEKPQPVNLIVKPEPEDPDPLIPVKPEPVIPEPIKPEPIDPVPVLIAWTISASLRDGGTVTGTVSYEPTTPVQATNVRGLHPNITYILTAWDIVVTTSFEEPVHFANLKPIPDKYELCVGSCIFAASQGSERLWLSDNGLHELQMVFQRPPLPSLALPVTASEWGPVDVQASWSKNTQRYTILLAGASIQLKEELP